MSFSSRRRNYLLTPHRRDGLVEWIKSMLMHSFVLDALDATAADTFSHVEVLIDEHRMLNNDKEGKTTNSNQFSRLQKLVPTVGTFHTHLPLRKAFIMYNNKYSLTKRRHICISFNELRHILNLAQIMALWENASQCEGDGTISRNSNLNRDYFSDDTNPQSLKNCAYSPGFLPMPEPSGLSPPSFSLGPSAVNIDEEQDSSSAVISTNKVFKGPKMITFDGDQTLYSDGANFESNPELADYLYRLLTYGVIVAVVTAAGYEYQTEKYEFRLSGLLSYFKERNMPTEACERFYLFGGECNYLLHLGHDYRLHPVREYGPGGWHTSTKHIKESPSNWEEEKVQSILDHAENIMQDTVKELNIRGRVIRKKRSVGLIPLPNQEIRREALDESVLRTQTVLSEKMSYNIDLPFCAFNGGKDMWLDVGNKRVGVQILSAYLGITEEAILHIGDQFLNTGNDFAARDVCPCIWITSPEETTYILKSMLRLSGMPIHNRNNSELLSSSNDFSSVDLSTDDSNVDNNDSEEKFSEITRRHSRMALMDVYTGEMRHGGA